jgi:hypothetical protein
MTGSGPDDWYPGMTGDTCILGDSKNNPPASRQQGDPLGRGIPAGDRSAYCAGVVGHRCQAVRTTLRACVCAALAKTS